MRMFLCLLALVAALGASASAPDSSLTLQEHIRTAAHRYRIDPNLVRAIIETESGPLNGPKHLGKNAVSSKGAKGLMQVMPLTADEMGIANPHHALSNLMGACEYLRMLLNRYKFNLPKTLAAYNAGPSNVDKYKGIPPFRETRAYVRKVLAAYERFQNQ
jgi:soluble lytic murein transglycosylase-like protein